MSSVNFLLDAKDCIFVFTQGQMKMNRLYIVFFLFLIGWTTHAQQWCGSTVSDGDFEVKEMPARAKTVITIPVVVHVIWSEEQSNITDEQIASQIEVLNRDFRAQNPDRNLVESLHYQGVLADMEINFEIAETNCQGNPEIGIIRKEVPPTFWNNSFENNQRKICHDELYGSSAWCPSCYLNIWVVGEFIAAGRGVFPFELGDNQGDVPFDEDGVYIQHDRFGTLGTVTEPYHLGRTLTHEIGHYLNLFHPWGANDPGEDCNATLCCGQPEYDDYVEDTKPQIKTYFNQCPTGLQLSCGEEANYQNFMGYSDDPCLIMFTEGQKARAWDALMTYRSGLLDSECIITAVDEVVVLDEWVGNIWIQNSYLQMEIKETPLYCQLYNMEGRLISEWETVHQGLEERSFLGLSKGVYILRVKKEGQFLVRRLVNF